MARKFSVTGRKLDNQPSFKAKIASLVAQGLFILTAGTVVVNGLNDRAGAENIAKDAGFTEMEYKGTGRLFDCPNRQALYRDTFNAKAADGRNVTITVCQAPFSILHAGSSLQVKPRVPT